MLEYIVPLLIGIFGSSGLWIYIHKKQERKYKKEDDNDLIKAMLLGLAHDRILTLGKQYINDQYICVDDYTNLYKYLYLPYTKLGGNGSAEKIMQKVDNLKMDTDHCKGDIMHD